MTFNELLANLGPRYNPRSQIFSKLVEESRKKTNTKNLQETEIFITFNRYFDVLITIEADLLVFISRIW